MAVTPCVFCAVIAVTMDAPYTPSAEKGFRSAWMPKQPPRVLGAYVLLPDMHAVGLRDQRDIDAVVDDQRNPSAGEHGLDRPRGLDHLARVPMLVAQLDQRRATSDDQPRQFGERTPV